MADYTTPPWSQLVAGKPWTDEKAAAAFENPIAIAEGAPDAPRVRIGALQRLSPGSEVRLRSDDEYSSSSGGFTKLSYWFLQAGTVRLYFEHKASTTNSNVYPSVVRVRDGIETVVASFASSTSYVARAVDCAVLPGDRIDLRAVTSSSYTIYLKNCRFQTAGEDLYPTPATTNVGVLEGNTYNA